MRITELVGTLLFLALLPFGCSTDPVNLAPEESPQIRLHVTGGFAGADYTISLDGLAGEVRGESCISFCQFEAGEVLRTLTREQVDHVQGLFLSAGIHALNGTDFGNECCDQIHFDLEYGDEQGVSRVRGTSEEMPAELREALVTVMVMAWGSLPVSVDFGPDLEHWARDPLQIQDARVSGEVLEVDLTYSGGCGIHDFWAVAWGGWIESSPVQVWMFLSHDDHDDACDAIVQRTVRFGLENLKTAYEASYGIGEPGGTTLVLLLEDPQLSGPPGVRSLEYRF